jgi:hypothetical protein
MKSTLLASSLALAGICAVPAFAADAEVSIDFKTAYVATGATCLDGWVAMPNLWVGGMKAGETEIPISFDVWGCMDLEGFDDYVVDEEGNEYKFKNNQHKRRFEEIDLEVDLDLGALWTPDEDFSWSIGYLEYDYPGYDWKADNLVIFTMGYGCFLNPKFTAKYRVGGDSKGKLEAGFELSEGVVFAEDTAVGDIGAKVIADIWYVNNDDVDGSDLESGLACADVTAKLTFGAAYVGCTYVAQIDDDVLTDEAYDAEWIASIGAAYGF